MKSDTVAVIPEAEAIHDAYMMGFNRFDEMEFDHESDDLTPHDRLNSAKEMGTFINNVDPKLRALAGHVDSGPGTYTVQREVVVIPHGNEDDIPMDGKHMSAQHVLSCIQEAFDQGAIDAMQGKTPNEERAGLIAPPQ